MLFKNFDKFSSVLHFSTLNLLLFSCRKSLRFFSAHILKLCVFPQKCAWKTQNADQKLSVYRICKKVNIITVLNAKWPLIKYSPRSYLFWLPVKTAPVENGPSPKRPHFRLKGPQFSVKTAPYQKSSVKTAPNRKVTVVFCEFSFNLYDLTSR